MTVPQMGAAKYVILMRKKDSRIVVIHKENEGTVVGARKAGAKAATGEYVINVDGDDWIGSTRIETLVRKGISSGADMVYLNGRYIQWGDTYSLEEPCIEEGSYSSADICSYLQDIDVCFIRRLIPCMWCWGIKRELHLRIQMMVDSNILTASDLVFFLALSVGSRQCLCHERNQLLLCHEIVLNYPFTRQTR